MEIMKSWKIGNHNPEKLETNIPAFETVLYPIDKYKQKQAGAELCQAQTSLN